MIPAKAQKTSKESDTEGTKRESTHKQERLESSSPLLPPKINKEHSLQKVLNHETFKREESSCTEKSKEKESPCAEMTKVSVQGKESVEGSKKESGQQERREPTNTEKKEKGEKEGGGKGGGEQEQKEQQEEKEKERQKLKVEAQSGNASHSDVNKEEEKSSDAISSEPTGDIFTRFMALMARILGQAQADAHTLYQRIKERTDNIDILTGLLAKLNTTKGKIDWSKDPQMKALVDKARAIGVEIPEGKYSWSEEEKRYLKENIQTRKDTLEKVTQLERTDMQRYMQEASQCHQARSNVLKLIKEIMDTIIHNIK
jgi:hypothetical protein